ncbi:hypothetical protein PV326_001195 [Microctonus aethiopoides]|nr:hypothetical protein PV326_001195 [Microctonus aethiopoides]
MSKVTETDHKTKNNRRLQQYNKRVRYLKSETRNILSRSLPREIRHRDPKIHVEGYVTGEQYLNESPTCDLKCSGYNRTKHHNHLSIFTMNSNLICHGTIYDCKESTYEKICEQPHSKGNDRRYAELINFFEWKRRNCSNKSNPKNSKKITAFTVVEAGVLPWARTKHQTCELCACYCDYKNSPRSIRSFSLKEVNSNINENYVITGIRFRIVNQVVCLQIQQGKLINTIIDPKTVRWQPVHLSKLENNNDVVRLNYTKRSLNLDDVEVSRRSIVTGVKFQMIDDRLTLMVSGVEIFKNGSINSSPIWYSAKSNVETREEININDLNVPTSSSEENEILSQPNDYFIKFTTTSWISDEAQTVVPFIDLQEVATDPPSPIGGVGIYHKRQKTDGGFIAPKLLSANYLSFL